MRRAVCPAFALVALLSLFAVPARGATCPHQDTVRVPGAEEQVADCLDDLTTKGTATTGHTDQSDWATLHSRASRNPAAVVPGVQVDGYFPDTSTSNAYRGWMHDAQFVIRLPNRWNGKLVVTGAPGVRRQFAADYVIGDFALARGYAYASTDKGNSGTTFYRDGARPGDAVAEWHRRVTELTRAAQDAVRSRYGRGPARTYMTGISNGGYLTRWQLENHPELYAGGVDWEGTLMLADGPTCSPTCRPRCVTTRPGSAGTRRPTGRSWRPGSPPGVRAAVGRPLRRVLGPHAAALPRGVRPRLHGPFEAGTPFCQPGGAPGCDADYDYASRPQAVKDAVGRVSLTGRIGKPMLTLHGTLDALLPIRTDSDVYTRMIRDAGRGSLHRYYVVEGGSHVDSRYDRYPDALRPILPCYRSAFTAFEAWIERDQAPPPSQTVARTAGGDVANACPLTAAAGAGGTAGGSTKPRLRLRVAPRRARAGRRTRFRFRVTARGRPVRGAKVRFLGRTKKTGRRGRARMMRRPARRGVRRATARKPGFRPARARVRIRPART